MNAPGTHEALPEDIVEQAIAWQVRLESGLAGVADREALMTWRQADPAHEEAWQRLAQMQDKLRQLPPGLARATLSAPGLKRRTVLKSCLLLAAVGGLAVSNRLGHSGRLTAMNLETGRGERRQLELADHSQLHVNADTMLSVHFTEQIRTLTLMHGDILVTTPGARDKRPFIVHTPQGHIRALGTRFLVRQQRRRTEVSVFEGKVEISFDDRRPPLEVAAGQAFSLNREGMPVIAAASPDADAWTRGFLVAHSMRIDDLLEELGHYRNGHLACSHDIANLRISGVFPLDDTEQALSALESTLPVSVRRITPLWVDVLPRHPT